MPDRPYKAYWDACVFLSLIEGTPDRIAIINTIIDECRRNEVEIYTSVLSIAEVAFAKAEKDGKVLDSAVDKKIDKLWIPSSPFKLVEIHSALMHSAKSLMRKAHGGKGWALKPADAIHLVTAQSVRVDAFHTYDDKLPKLSELLGITIEKPRTDRFVWEGKESESPAPKQAEPKAERAKRKSARKK